MNLENVTTRVCVLLPTLLQGGAQQHSGRGKYTRSEGDHHCYSMCMIHHLFLIWPFLTILATFLARKDAALASTIFFVAVPLFLIITCFHATVGH
jgi:hypothetical protein